jgi:hypothetical protein
MTGYPTRLYGFWLQEYEHAEKSVWKDCFRPSVLEAIEILSDDDPYNDQTGYASFAIALLHASNIDNGTSALSKSTRFLGDNTSLASKMIQSEEAGDFKQPEIKDSKSRK